MASLTTSSSSVSLRHLPSSSWSRRFFSNFALPALQPAAPTPSRRFITGITRSAIFNKLPILRRKEVDILEASMAEILAETSAPEINPAEWAKQDDRRLINVVLRVGDLDKSIEFYTECLGMKVLLEYGDPEDHKNAFLGYGIQESQFIVQLAYTNGFGKYDIGDELGHISLAVFNLKGKMKRVKPRGGKILRDYDSTKDDGASLAVIEDPDGYKFELMKERPKLGPIFRVMFPVNDLDRSIRFYEKALGMELVQRTNDPESKFTAAIMGYGPEGEHVVLELRCNYEARKYEKGDGYAQITIGTSNVYNTANTLELFGGKIIGKPGPLPDWGTRSTACKDLDGRNWVFFDNTDYLIGGIRQYLSS